MTNKVIKEIEHLIVQGDNNLHVLLSHSHKINRNIQADNFEAERQEAAEKYGLQPVESTNVQSQANQSDAREDGKQVGTDADSQKAQPDGNLAQANGAGAAEVEEVKAAPAPESAEAQGDAAAQAPEAAPAAPTKASKASKASKAAPASDDAPAAKNPWD